MDFIIYFFYRFTRHFRTSDSEAYDLACWVLGMFILMIQFNIMAIFSVLFLNGDIPVLLFFISMMSNIGFMLYIQWTYEEGFLSKLEYLLAKYPGGSPELIRMRYAFWLTFIIFFFMLCWTPWYFEKGIYAKHL